MKEILMRSTLLYGSVVLGLLLTGCDTPADVAARNIAQEADNFRINRRIVFYNGITGTYMMVIEGRCSLGNNEQARQRTVICQTGQNEYKRHFVGLSDNVTYFVEQLGSASVSTYRYQVTFNPATIIPSIEVH